MHSDATVFTEMRFWALVLCSLVLPTAIFVTLFVRREFSKVTVLAFGSLLILLAGVDIFLLRALANMARATPSLADDLVFSSALSIARHQAPAQQPSAGAPARPHALPVRRTRTQVDSAEAPGTETRRSRAPRARWLYANPGARRRRVVSRASLR